jgi:hypothetical protein
VLATIELDDEPRLVTNEIDDVASERLLSLELEPQKAMSSKLIPKP